jgi:hypothetical protein
MIIEDIFRRDIFRRIEEVVKVDLTDPEVVASELDEYVATEHILAEMKTVVDEYQENINSPNETCNVWVSGFFGSGKSSWAKIVGFLLENTSIDGVSAQDRFFSRTHAPELRATLTTIHSQAPTLTVLLNLATGSDVVGRQEDSVLLPVYRALLKRLGYASNILLAELEITLEADGRFSAFVDKFAETHGRDWADRRYTALAKNEASRVLHELDPSTFSSPDSYARAAVQPDLNADWFASRAIELLERRGGGTKRICFVVDEAGQYVARSIQRMLDLQGLAESFQKQVGKLWLIVTSQEKLSDVVDSLEARQVELARAQARFPLRPDLLPEDIEEVTRKRVLDKTEAGSAEVGAHLEQSWHQFSTHTLLNSPTRAKAVSRDEVIRLYPMVPYQIQLLIDAVSARRAQGGASPTISGAARTIIRHAQQLVVHPKFGMGAASVGNLVTLDRSYDLLAELIPTAWRSEIEQVSTSYGPDSFDARVLKVIALCSEVPALPLTADNIAVLLHPSVAAESVRAEVEAALANQLADDRIRESSDGYRLQSPEQKDWEQTRRGIDLSPGGATRLRRELIRNTLSGLTVTDARTFRVRVDVDGETVSPGDITLSFEDHQESRHDEVRARSRQEDHKTRLTWAYQVSESTFETLLEVHRSREIIQRRDTATRTPAELELLGEERERLRRNEAKALLGLSADLTRGRIFFRGTVEEPGAADLRSAAQQAVSSQLSEIYPQIRQFTAPVRREDILSVLRTTDLRALPNYLGSEGIGLLRETPQGPQFNTETGPLAELVQEARKRTNYGQDANGAALERHFNQPPWGASVEVIQVLTAAALRSGLLEVIHQGQIIRNPTDQRLDTVLTALPRFRAALLRPPSSGSGITTENRAELAQWLEDRGVHVPGIGTDVLAGAVRSYLAPYQSATQEVDAQLKGLGLTTPAPVSRTLETVTQLSTADDDQVVLTALASSADLTNDLPAIDRAQSTLTTQLENVRNAIHEARHSGPEVPADLVESHRELNELLSGGDLLDHIARMSSLADSLRTVRREANRQAAQTLTREIGALKQSIDVAFADLDPHVVEEAVRPLDVMAPTGDLEEYPAATSLARIDSARARAGDAAAQLEEVRAQGQLARLDVAALVPEPIVDEATLAAALDLIRESVVASWAEGKSQVRLL